MRIYFDIETIPNQHPDAMTRARASIKPPGNYKKADSIAAWMETEGEQAAEEAFLRTALDAAEGEVCCLSFAIDDGVTVALPRLAAQGEREYLKDALLHLHEEVTRAQDQDNEFTSSPPLLIAHNAAFDIGFIRRRCMVHGIKPPKWFPPAFARDLVHYGDTMTLWAGMRERISLDRLCTALNVPSPKVGGIDGGSVYPLWQAGKFTEIAAYNIRDVEAVRTCWKRMHFEETAA